MKSTGIVRRIDDLGRVVIPKEIRLTMGIKDGDPLELFMDGKDTICFKKYHTENDAVEILNSALELLVEHKADNASIIVLRNAIETIKDLVKDKE